MGNRSQIIIYHGQSDNKPNEIINNDMIVNHFQCSEPATLFIAIQEIIETIKEYRYQIENKIKFHSLLLDKIRSNLMENSISDDYYLPRIMFKDWFNNHSIKNKNDELLQIFKMSDNDCGFSCISILENRMTNQFQIEIQFFKNKHRAFKQVSFDNYMDFYKNKKLDWDLQEVQATIDNFNHFINSFNVKNISENQITIMI